MNRIIETFSLCRKEHRSALICFLTAGDPNREESQALLESVCSAGLDLLELGIPFSDPTADGPTIQKASQRALSSGTNLAGCLEYAKFIRKKFPNLPIILFGYYNPILVYGARKFIQDAIEAQIDGYLCVDLPVERSFELNDFIPSDVVFDPIYLISPTTTEERIKMILSRASGFVYIQSHAGVTGVRNTPDNMQIDFIRRKTAQVRKYSNLPTVLGFGISTPTDIAKVSSYCDGAVVGSAIIKIIERNIAAGNGKYDRASTINELLRFIESLKNANQTIKRE